MNNKNLTSNFDVPEINLIFLFTKFTMEKEEKNYKKEKKRISVKNVWNKFDIVTYKSNEFMPPIKSTCICPSNPESENNIRNKYFIKKKLKFSEVYSQNLQAISVEYAFNDAYGNHGVFGPSKQWQMFYEIYFFDPIKKDQEIDLDNGKIIKTRSDLINRFISRRKYTLEVYKESEPAHDIIQRRLRRPNVLPRFHFVLEKIMKFLYFLGGIEYDK